MTVRAGSAAAGSSVSAALGNAASLQTALASAGVATTVSVTSPPTTVLANAAPPTAGAAAQHKTMLLALLCAVAVALLA